MGAGWSGVAGRSVGGAAAEPQLCLGGGGGVRAGGMLRICRMSYEGCPLLMRPFGSVCDPRSPAEESRLTFEVRWVKPCI